MERKIHSADRFAGDHTKRHPLSAPTQNPCASTQCLLRRPHCGCQPEGESCPELQPPLSPQELAPSHALCPGRQIGRAAMGDFYKSLNQGLASCHQLPREDTRSLPTQGSEGIGARNAGFGPPEGRHRRRREVRRWRRQRGVHPSARQGGRRAVATGVAAAERERGRRGGDRGAREREQRAPQPGRESSGHVLRQPRRAAVGRQLPVRGRLQLLPLPPPLLLLRRFLSLHPAQGVSCSVLLFSPPRNALAVRMRVNQTHTQMSFSWSTPSAQTCRSSLFYI